MAQLRAAVHVFVPSCTPIIQARGSSSDLRNGKHTCTLHFAKALLNSRHLVTSLLVSPSNNVCLRNERRRNSILMTCHYPDLSSASDWLRQISFAARPIRSISQICIVTCHQYGISALDSQTSFRGDTSGGVAKCRLFFFLGYTACGFY